MGRITGKRAAAAAIVILALCASILPATPAFAGSKSSAKSHHTSVARRRHVVRRPIKRPIKRVKHAPAPARLVKLQLLAVNDFHGALETRTLNKRPIGGAAGLAAYLNSREASATALGEKTLKLGGGDLVGASPPVSALLGDVPTIQAFNMMGLDYSVVGNHEFDKGIANLRYLQNGPARAWGWRRSKDATFTGADFRYLGANVVSTATGKPELQPYAIREIGGVRVAIIGVILKGTPSIVTPSGVAGLTFLDEATTVNTYVTKLKKSGIHTFIVLLHQGGYGDRVGGPITGDVAPIVQAMDNDVDVVISAHSHAGYQGLIGTKLVTQAYSSGTAFADIDMTLDRKTGDCTTKTAEIVDTYDDVAPGNTPDAAIANFVADTRLLVAPIINQVVGTSTGPILNSANAAGETPAGDFIADAQRWQMGTQIAFMNPGGVRSDVATSAGPVTWGALFTAQPFNNYCVKMDLTGAQIKTALEQQWVGQSYAKVLAPSGITYSYDAAAPLGSRVTTSSIMVGGVPLSMSTTYSVTINNFLAGGGDNFLAFKGGTNQVVGAVDIDALVAYVKQLSQPFGASAGGRITRVN